MDSCYGSQVNTKYAIQDLIKIFWAPHLGNFEEMRDGGHVQ